MKKIRITESDIARMVEDSVISILESDAISDLDDIMAVINANREKNPDSKEVDNPYRKKEKIVNAPKKRTFDDKGNPYPDFEPDLYDDFKNDRYQTEFPDEGKVSAPEGWEELYLKARRNWNKATANKMRRNDDGEMGDADINAWSKALKAEYPDPRERNKAFNRFAKRIERFRHYEPHKYDSIADDDPNASWNQKRRR